MKSFFFCPDAWIAALLEAYSASHSRTVFAVDGPAEKSAIKPKAAAAVMQAIE
jgi:hypothetical protein